VLQCGSAASKEKLVCCSVLKLPNKQELFYSFHLFKKKNIVSVSLHWTLVGARQQYDEKHREKQ
jgi:hypothetical protein